MVMGVPAVVAVVVAEADAGVADAAAVANVAAAAVSSRCPCVADVVAPGWLQMLAADVES